MLSELSIENFAIIDRLLVRFDPGFTVLTGETGAGKSIIIDALHAALGARATGDVVREGANLASVEAVFSSDVLEDPGLATILEDSGIVGDDCLILRREISAAGRGSARINGRAVPLAVLGSVGDHLVDIHGQTDHLSILRRDRQLDVLDRFSGLTEPRARVTEGVRAFARLQRELQEISAGQREAEQRLDLLRFQVGEIDAARIRVGEEEELEAERYLLANAERLTQLSASAYTRLTQDPSSTLEALGEAESNVRDLTAIDSSLEPLNARLQSARVEIEDIAQDLRLYRDSVEYDPQRLEVVEERIDLIVRLKRKYGATLQEVLDFGANARADLESVENLDERIAALADAVRDVQSQVAAAVIELSAARADAADRLTVAMAEALQGLGLNGTRFEVDVSRVESEHGLLLPDGRRYGFSATGIDSVAFLVSFNPGEPLRPLERVASGGETSRFLLSLKSVLAGADRTPTLVFDEVDVGVGGRHGTVIGERLRQLSRSHQVLSITHLPQIAALADQHLSVSKTVSQGRTGVEVRLLDGGEREGEIAEMMSGKGTEAARRNARELLEAAQRRS